jgi:hypothetical protein
VSQQGAMVHEGIHSILASLPGCKDAAWFHEGGNTWLQQEADSRRSGDYSSMGFLNAAAMIAPFMPVECYSGWLQDGSFGGPSAEGVNMYNDSTQICTWKNLLGGTQYGNLFPTFLGQTLGDGAVPWIWKYCTSRVLEGMASELGEAQIRRLICEYRAKQAVVDFGVWNNAIIALLDAYMGTTIQEEWSPYNIDCNPWTATPYVETSNNGSGLLTPESWTTPGWSGANQIPLTVSGNEVSVNFQPIRTNMRCQLCYIATDGSRVYSEIVPSGTCSLTLTKSPANNVVIAVITNTNYIYEGESTRTAHFDYRLQLGTGVTEAADINTKWYKGVSLKSATSLPVSTYDISKYCSHSYNAKKPVVAQNNKEPLKNSNAGSIRIYPNPLFENDVLHIDLNLKDKETGTIQISSIKGQVVYSEKTASNHFSLETTGILKKGLYFISINISGNNQIYKLMVN